MRAGLVLAALLFASAALADGTPTSSGGGETCRPGLRAMARVDLFFGAVGSGSAWQRFLAQEVTPRFPDGLTVLDGRGQWRGKSGLEREPTRILIIYYRRDASSDARIEAIRTIYEKRFRQMSVLRADSVACVGF